MEYMLYSLWAIIELLYSWLMFSTFSRRKHNKENSLWFMVIVWLCYTICTCLSKEFVFLYFVRLLAMVLMEIYFFQENGQRGLWVLLGSFGGLLLPELLVRYLTEYQSVSYYAAITVLKVLSILVALIANRYFTDRVNRQEVQKLEMLLQRQHMEMQTESINALEQNYRMQRKVTHEFEHHLQVLDDLLNSGAVTDAQGYIRQLRGNRAYRVISVNSQHTVIDAILNQKYQTAQENGIKMQIRVNDLSEVALPTDSLVVILSNLLDNALEACRGIDRYQEIDCSILYEDNLYIAIQNTSGPVRIINGKIDTTKPDKWNHGYGLDSVCYLLDKLGAEYIFDYADGWFRFVVEIPT